jgi:hypothetical protein
MQEKCHHILPTSRPKPEIAVNPAIMHTLALIFGKFLKPIPENTRSQSCDGVQQRRQATNHLSPISFSEGKKAQDFLIRNRLARPLRYESHKHGCTPGGWSIGNFQLLQSL